MNVLKHLLCLMLLCGMTTNGNSQIVLPRQDKVDEAINEFHKVKDRQPYVNGSNVLMKASNAAAKGADDLRPHIIIRSAVYEYMQRYNIKWPDKNDEYYEWKGLISQYDYLSDNQRTYGVTLLNVKTRLDFFKYYKRWYAPMELIRMYNILENMPPYQLEPELMKYYSLLRMQINEKERKRMLDTINQKFKDYTVDDILYSGVVACLGKNTRGMAKQIADHLRTMDVAAADALEGYYLENKGISTDEELRLALEYYDKAAAKGNVLGCIRRADYLLDEDINRAGELLSLVESHPHFSDYTGTVVKSDLLSRSDKIDDIREASRLAQDAIDKCLDSYQVKYIKKVYDECQLKITVHQLEEQESMLDLDDVLPAELTAIAMGYESIEGYEDKVIYYYRLAAEHGDIPSLCRVCVYDMFQGIAEEDDAKVKNAANIILENKDSDFLPFKYNSVYIYLFGLNGDEPNQKAASKLFKSFVNKLKSDNKTNLYKSAHFISDEEVSSLPDEDDELLNQFMNYYKAIEYYSKGLELESKGLQDDAEYYYSWSSTYGHPFGWEKSEMIRKKR